MKYDDIHPILRRALGDFEGFRKLGFKPDDIFIYRHTRTGTIQSIIRPEKGKQFSIDNGRCEFSGEKFEQEWLKAVQAWNGTEDALSEDDRQRIWEESLIRQQPVEVIMRIRAKGIVIPSIRWSDKSTPHGRRQQAN